MIAAATVLAASALDGPPPSRSSNFLPGEPTSGVASSKRLRGQHETPAE